MLAYKKRIVSILCTTGLITSYIYNKHFYEKELFNRYNELLQNNTKLSGVYLQQRQPFGSLWFINWLLPYHQSLKIVQKDGTIRNVGLGKISNKFFNRDVGFVLHEGEQYDKLQSYETSIPIECWVDYKRKYGHYPSKNIDIDILQYLTLTKEESRPGDILYTSKFGDLVKDHNGEVKDIVTCRYAVMDVIKKGEDHLLTLNRD